MSNQPKSEVVIALLVLIVSFLTMMRATIMFFSTHQYEYIGEFFLAFVWFAMSFYVVVDS